MIFNTHSHINTRLDEIDELLKNAIENDVVNIAVVGFDKESSLLAYNLSKQYDMLYCICGIQPEEIEHFDGDYSFLHECLSYDKCIALGEIGLDYYYGKDSKEQQLKIYEEQLQIATKYKKPIAIHCRDSHEDNFNMLSKYASQLDGIIMHCYSGSVEMMKRYLKLGCYISFSGVVTFKNAKEIKEVVKECPLDRILVETDDPYLTPVPFRGQVNKPGYVRYVIEEIAMLKEMKIEELKKAVYENTLRVFHL